MLTLFVIIFEATMATPPSMPPHDHRMFGSEAECLSAAEAQETEGWTGYCQAIEVEQP